MKRYLIFLLFLTLGLSACSLIERSAQSGYDFTGETSVSSITEYEQDKRQKKWSQAREDLGYNNNTELNDGQVAAIQNRVELARLEQNLPNQMERKQYYALKPYFKSDIERIYFLKLPTVAARERWAAYKGVTTDEKDFDPTTQYLIENSDVAKSMTRNAVRQSWGDPDFVDVAGDPLYGNERWRYNKLVPTDEGYKSETRIIYFEAGRVVGWETTN